MTPSERGRFAGASTAGASEPVRQGEPGHQGLRFFNRSDRIMQGIDFRKDGHIQLVEIPPGESAQFWIYALAVFMAGRMKRSDVPFCTGQQDIHQRRTFLTFHVRW